VAVQDIVVSVPFFTTVTVTESVAADADANVVVIIK